MKKLLIAFALLFSLNAQAQETKCEKFTNLTTKTLAITLNCRSETNIRSDVQKFTRSIGACPQTDEKGLVCTIVAKGGVFMVQRQIPSYWLCKPDIAMKVLEMGLNKVCVSLTGL